MKYFVRIIHSLDQYLTSELTANEWRGWRGMKCLRFSLHIYFKTTTWKKKNKTKQSLTILRFPLNLLKFSKWKQSDSKPGKQNCKSQVVGCLPVGSKPRNWRKIWEMSPYVGICPAKEADLGPHALWAGASDPGCLTGVVLEFTGWGSGWGKLNHYSHVKRQKRGGA